MTKIEKIIENFEDYLEKQQNLGFSLSDEQKSSWTNKLWRKTLFQLDTQEQENQHQVELS